MIEKPAFMASILPKWITLHLDPADNGRPRDCKHRLVWSLWIQGRVFGRGTDRFRVGISARIIRRFRAFAPHPALALEERPSRYEHHVAICAARPPLALSGGRAGATHAALLNRTGTIAPTWKVTDRPLGYQNIRCALHIDPCSCTSALPPT